MTREQAQEILALHRSGAEAQDPEVAQALQLAATDTELARWLAQQQEFHKHIAAQFARIEAPADLKTRIVSGAKENAKTSDAPRGRMLLAIAASIIFVLGVGSFWFSKGKEERTFANFRSRMTGFALRTYQMDVLSTDERVVRQHLATRGAPADFPLTPGLQKTPFKGGGRLWQNQPVAMICFSLTNNETAYMFVVDQSAVAGTKPAETVQVEPGRNLNSVSWTQDGRIYLLVAAEQPEVLASLAAR